MNNSSLIEDLVPPKKRMSPQDRERQIVNQAIQFFAKHGFSEISDVPVDEQTFQELVRSNDDGVAEFLDLARVKQNTLGNTRMLKVL